MQLNGITFVKFDKIVNPMKNTLTNLVILYYIFALNNYEYMVELHQDLPHKNYYNQH